MSVLVQPDEAPRIASLDMPRQLYWVLCDPAPLAGMEFPNDKFPWDELYRHGFRHVVCLTSDSPHYDPAPLRSLCAISLEDLSHGGTPQDPAAEERRIRSAVDAALSRLRSGEGVVVHCQGGRGRTGTVIGCILRALGVPGDEVLEYLQRLHRARGKPGWPESDWQAEIVRKWGER